MENLNKKIWVKRTYTGGVGGGHIQIPLKQFDEVQKDNESNLKNHKSIAATYYRMPFYYGYYRYIKSNFPKVFWWFISILIAIALTIFATNKWGK